MHRTRGQHRRRLGTRLPGQPVPGSDPTPTSRRVPPALLLRYLLHHKGLPCRAALRPQNPCKVRPLSYPEPTRHAHTLTGGLAGKRAQGRPLDWFASAFGSHVWGSRSDHTWGLGDPAHRPGHGWGSRVAATAEQEFGHSCDFGDHWTHPLRLDQFGTFAAAGAGTGERDGSWVRLWRAPQRRPHDPKKPLPAVRSADKPSGRAPTCPGYRGGVAARFGGRNGSRCALWRCPRPRGTGRPAGI